MSRLEPSGRAVHGEVDGLDIGEQRGRRLVLLRPTHRLRRRPYPICPSRSGNAWHPCGGVYAGPALFWKARCRRIGAGVGDESAESCRVVQPFRIPLVIRPVHSTYAILVRWNDEFLCGRWEWVSRFEMPCISTRWTGEHCVEQVFSFHGTACWRQCGSIATKLSKLDVCEGWKHVRWCRTQASSPNSHGVVDGGVDETDMSTAAPNRSG